MKIRKRWTLPFRQFQEAAAAGTRERHHLELRRLAHDLRNPLNSILLNAQFLEEAEPSPETVRISQRIQKQALELAAILDRALGPDAK
jgi:signal transduction histidine kinase